LARQRLRLLLNHAHGVRPPSLQRRGPLDDRGAGQGRNAVAHQGLGAQGWSVYGAKRAQPAATDGVCEGLENGSYKPIGNPWQRFRRW
jgi:hypothetical protein